MKNKFVLVSVSDGWEGLYVDGKLVEEGHHLTMEFLAQYLGLDFYSAEVSDENTECGCLPEDIDGLIGVNLGQRK